MVPEAIDLTGNGIRPLPTGEIGKGAMKDNANGMPSSDLETLRQMAIHNVVALKRENAPRISEPAWSSYTGYNYGRWADRGFNIALGLLENTAPQAGEAGPDYLRRVIELVRAQRDAYRADQEDEDGACSGALDAAMWAIIDALPKEPHPRVPDSSTEWELWYTDTFDRETPPMLEASGRGILEGLIELWQHTLGEGITDSGSASFSRFSLTWKGEDFNFVAVHVNPFDNHTLAKLRRWVRHPSGTGPNKTEETEDAARRYQATALLRRLAQLHLRLLRKSDRWTAERISSSEEARQLLSHIESMEHPSQLLELEEDSL